MNLTYAISSTQIGEKMPPRYSFGHSPGLAILWLLEATGGFQGFFPGSAHGVWIQDSGLGVRRGRNESQKIPTNPLLWLYSAF